MERWRDVRGYRGRYQVSDLGRVRSLPRWQKWRDGRVRFIPGGVLSHNLSGGYHYVSLYSLGRRRQVRVNRLVAKAFVPNPEGKPEVNHEDLDKNNNRSDNLTWMTRSENVEHYALHAAGSASDWLGEEDW